MKDDLSLEKAYCFIFIRDAFGVQQNIVKSLDSINIYNVYHPHQ